MYACLNSKSNNYAGVKMITSGWDSPAGLIKSELTQLEYEGYVVPESVKEKVGNLDPIRDAFDEGKISRLYEMIENLPRNPKFKYVQPNDLEGIRAVRPDGPRKLKMNLSESELLDR